MVLDKCQVMLEYVLSMLQSDVFDLNDATNKSLRETVTKWYGAMSTISNNLMSAALQEEVEEVVEGPQPIFIREQVPATTPKRRKRKRSDFSTIIPVPPTLPKMFGMRVDSDGDSGPDWFDSGDPVPDEDTYGGVVRLSQRKQRSGIGHQWKTGATCTMNGYDAR